MSVKEVMTNLADAARARYSVSDKLTVADITDLIQGENADVAKLIDRSITKIEIPEGVTEIGKEAFRGCSQLTEVTLPSTITSIGENAFADCGALSAVYCSFEKADIAGYPWGALPGTVFYFNGIADSSFSGLTLIAEETGSTVKLTTIGSPITSGLQYRTNDNDEFSPYTIDTKITLNNVGDYVQFKNTEDTLSIDIRNFIYFKLGGKIAASGNMQSMLNGRTDCVNFCFYYMFGGCTSLTKAPELPATTLAESCYYHMFKDCTSLTKAPELPATTLAEYCYYYMFEGCTSLTKAPELPATTLAKSCYNGMFGGCTSLTKAPELPATTLAEYCYSYMFDRCTSLTQAPELPATTLAKSCYSYMFDSCTSLTQAPELPATTLASYCYYYMFDNCTSLTQAPELPATTLAEYCYHYTFKDCTSLTKAPELPATTLALFCYYNMFSGCSKLSYINVGFTAWDETATRGWVGGVPSSGTFTCPSALPEEYGVDRIPAGWTVVRKD